MTQPPPKAPETCGLIGAGGHAGMVAATLARLGIVLDAVFETDPDRVGTILNSVPVQMDDGRTAGPLHIAIGSNAVRRRVAHSRPEADWLTLIHPDARVVDPASIGPGSLVAMGALVQAGVRLGRHVIVNSGAIVEHDCRIGDFAHIGPGAILTGGVDIGDGSLIGAGAVVLPGVSIGSGAIVGAGSVVVRPVAADQTVAGSPARPIARVPA